MNSDYQNLSTTYSLINQWLTAVATLDALLEACEEGTARQIERAMDNARKLADKLRKREPDIDLEGLLADHRGAQARATQPPSLPVADPKEQSDMHDMGEGNYRRMAAYEE